MSTMFLAPAFAAGSEIASALSRTESVSATTMQTSGVSAYGDAHYVAFSYIAGGNDYWEVIQTDPIESGISVTVFVEADNPSNASALPSAY